MIALSMAAWLLILLIKHQHYILDNQKEIIYNQNHLISIITITNAPIPKDLTVSKYLPKSIFKKEIPVKTAQKYSDQLYKNAKG